MSIARSRVERGITTKWNYLKDTVERYLIIKGKGIAEIGENLNQEVKEGDITIIPRDEGKELPIRVKKTWFLFVFVHLDSGRKITFKYFKPLPCL